MQKETILFVGANGFPFGSATIQRQVQLAKSLEENGMDVVVVCNRGAKIKAIVKREKINTHGYYQKVEYLYSSFISYKPKKFIKRNVFKILGRIVEPLVILYYKLFRNANYLFVNSVKIKTLIRYFIIAKLFKLEIIYDYVEYVSFLGKRNNEHKTEDLESFDFKFVKYVDKIVSISKYLDNHIDTIAPDIPRIMIPPIIDFSYIDEVKINTYGGRYILFCGSAAYNDIVEFIIDSFEKSDAIEKGFELKLVISANRDELKYLLGFIKRRESFRSVSVVSNIPYQELLTLYKNARALLIPLTYSLQDQARFPFKICEYTASKRPIITSNTGAIIDCFQDNVNALIAEPNNVDSFKSKINLVINNKEFSDNVGNSGYELGKNIFNYTTYGKVFKNFIKY